MPFITVGAHALHDWHSPGGGCIAYKASILKIPHVDLFPVCLLLLHSLPLFFHAPVGAPDYAVIFANSSAGSAASLCATLNAAQACAKMELELRAAANAARVSNYSRHSARWRHH